MGAQEGLSEEQKSFFESEGERGLRVRHQQLFCFFFRVVNLFCLSWGGSRQRRRRQESVRERCLWVHACMLICAGYLIIPDFASDEECTTLISRMDQLVGAFDPATISIFSTKNQVASPSSRRRMHGWITASLPLLQFATCLSWKEGKGIPKFPSLCREMMLACCQNFGKRKSQTNRSKHSQSTTLQCFFVFFFTSHAISNKAKQILWPAVELS